MCCDFEVTNDVVLKRKIDGKINVHFYCDKCSFRRERDNSLRDMESLFTKQEERKPHELSEEELDAIFKELDELSGDKEDVAERC